MNSFLKVLIISLSIMFMVYLGLAFAHWNFNMGDWHWLTRMFMFIMFWAILNKTAGIEIEERKKKEDDNRTNS